MAQLVSLLGPRQVVLEEVPDAPLARGQVRVRTLYSGISAGTELTAYRGTNPYLHKRWDQQMRLFQGGGLASESYPLRSWGYEEVGKVVELGPGVEPGRESLAPELGAVVYGTWGHRSTAVLDGQYAFGRLLPQGLEPILGIFSHIGSIALNGIHDANPRVGETVAVFGLGVLGQIVAQLAKAAGARVIGVDLDGSRLRLAREGGAVDAALDATEGGVAVRVKELTGGRGADVTIEVSGSAAALHDAIRATAYSARTVAMGFYQGGAEELFLGEEFHHNRIELRCSQISGVAPELSGRWDRLRLASTVMRLQLERVLRLEQLISRVVPAESAAEAYRQLDEQPGKALQVVLDFTAGSEDRRDTT
ncbi:MAG TPA: zinc-binding alcohol dehydrogenase [Trueperaceae bacterium]